MAIGFRKNARVWYSHIETKEISNDDNNDNDLRVNTVFTIYGLLWCVK